MQEILLTGITPEQLSCLDQRNPLTMALTDGHWEIAAQLLRTGWTAEDEAALNNLGWMYQKGLGVKQDYPEALSWFRKSASQGSAGAQDNLGWMYLNALGVEHDYTEAMSWFHKAAARGNCAAQSKLDSHYPVWEPRVELNCEATTPYGWFNIPTGRVRGTASRTCSGFSPGAEARRQSNASHDNIPRQQGKVVCEFRRNNTPAGMGKR